MIHANQGYLIILLLKATNALNMCWIKKDEQANFQSSFLIWTVSSFKQSTRFSSFIQGKKNKSNHAIKATIQIIISIMIINQMAKKSRWSLHHVTRLSREVFQQVFGPSFTINTSLNSTKNFAPFLSNTSTL